MFAYDVAEALRNLSDSRKMAALKVHSSVEPTVVERVATAVEMTFCCLVVFHCLVYAGLLATV